ncbi:MAG: copper resistance protein CopC [Actinomycetota bacterium]
MALVAVLIWLVPTPAHAHTDLSSSTPSDGASVEGPLAEIVLTFSGAVAPIEQGVAVAGADGATRVAALIEPVGTDTLVARFDPALPAGSYTAAWQVRSSDTHVIEGSLSFAVTPPTFTTAPAATPAVTTGPATTSPTVPSTTPSAGDPATRVPLDSEPPVAGPSTSAVAVDNSDTAAPSAATPAAPTLDTGVSDGSRATDFGRWISFPAAVIALGMLVFAAAAFAGRPADLGALAVVVRALGGVVAVGAAIELLGLGSIFGSVGDALGESNGRAALARLVGGAALAVGLGTLVVRRRRNEPPVALSAAVADEVSESHADAGSAPARWQPSFGNAVGIVGAAAIAASFALDGHTVSEGPHLLHGAVSVLHVLAAAAWVGGVLALAFLLHRRHRARVPSAAVEMTLRFSVIAMVALAAAAVAGVAMALMIDSDVAGYLDSEWGRLLAIKVALVAVAVGIGAYNHFVVLPRLEAGPHGEQVLAAARKTLTVEAVALVGAALVSAALVAASTLAS